MTWDLRGPFSLPRKGEKTQGKYCRTKEREGKKGLHGNVKRTFTDDLGLKGPFSLCQGKEKKHRENTVEQRNGKGKRACTGM